MIRIKTASLRAAITVMAIKDVRTYFNGVHILVRDDGDVHVQSSRGTCAFDDLMPDQSVYAPASIIIPPDAAKAIAKSRDDVVEIIAAQDGRFECAGLLFTSMGGEYPDFDRVMPARDPSFDGKVAHYDWELVALCQAALKIATGRKHAIYHLQNSPIGLLHRDAETYPRCAVAPLRETAEMFNGN